METPKKSTTSKPGNPNPVDPSAPAVIPMTLEQTSKLTLDQFDHLADGTELDHISDEDKRKTRLAIYHREMLSKQAQSRVPRAVQALGYVADLMDHLPTEGQKAAILAEVTSAFDDLKKRFEGAPKPEGKGFTLPTA